MSRTGQKMRIVHYRAKGGDLAKDHEQLRHFFEDLHSQPRQIGRTKKTIRHALLDLIDEKQDYQSISVKEILNRANIGRSTFYSHYQNKDEILLEAKGMLETFLEKAGSPILSSGSKSSEKIIGFSLPWFEHIHQTKLWALYKVLLGPRDGRIGRKLTEESLKELISKRFKTEFKKYEKPRDIPSDLLVQYLSGAFLAVLSWWYGQKNPATPQQVNTYFRALVLPALKTQLG